MELRREGRQGTARAAEPRSYPPAQSRDTLRVVDEIPTRAEGAPPSVGGVPPDRSSGARVRIQETARPDTVPATSPGVGPLSAWSVEEDPARLEALAGEWLSLCDDHGFFVGPDWTLSWLASHQDRVRPYVLLGRDAEGRLAGVLPLARQADGGLCVCGAEEGIAHVDVVAASGQASAVAEGALDLLAASGATRIRLDRLAEHGALLAAARGRAAVVPHTERVATMAPFLTHRTGWTAFLAALSKHQRHEVQRQCRRFWDREGAALRWIRDPSECAEGIATLFDLHERRFADKGKESVFQGEELRAFHTTLARRLAATDRLLLGFLLDGGRAVGSVYGFHQGGATLLFQTGIDPEFTATGAGVVLRAHVLRDEVLERGRTELDLLDGCYPWKARWATGVRAIVDLELFPATLAGRARGGVAAGVAALRSFAAAKLKGRRCPGLAADMPVEAKHCRRLGCAYAPGDEAGEDGDR